MKGALDGCCMIKNIIRSPYHGKFNAGYNSDSVKELFKGRKISDKRRTTLSKTSIMKHSEKCIAPYNKKVNQTNEWHIEVFHAVRVEGWKVAQIVRLVRKKKGSFGWDEIVHTDKKFKSLSRIVAVALKWFKQKLELILINWNLCHISRQNFSQNKVLIIVYNTSSENWIKEESVGKGIFLVHQRPPEEESMSYEDNYVSQSD